MLMSMRGAAAYVADTGRVSRDAYVLKRQAKQARSIPGKAKEYEHGTPEPDHVLVGEPPDAVADVRAGHRGDPVDHEAAPAPEPVELIGLNGKAD